MKNIRHPEARRQITEDVLTAAREVDAVDPWSQLHRTERRLLQTYAALAEKHGARVGQPGVSWAQDGDIATTMGVGVSTVRRARRALAKANGRPALIEVRYVGAFNLLPDGDMTLHGVNLVKIDEKNVPRAVPPAGAPATPTETGGYMETVGKNEGAVQKQTAELQRLHGEVADLRARLEGTEARAQSAEHRLASAEMRLAKQHARLDALERMGAARGGVGSGIGLIGPNGPVGSATISSGSDEAPQRGSLWFRTHCPTKSSPDCSPTSSSQWLRKGMLRIAVITALPARAA